MQCWLACPAGINGVVVHVAVQDQTGRWFRDKSSRHRQVVQKPALKDQTDRWFRDKSSRHRQVGGSGTCTASID